MSSGAIMAQIVACEREIQRLCLEISTLEEKIINQEDTQSAFMEQTTDYEDHLGVYERKGRGIESVAHVMRYAKKASSVMGIHKSDRYTKSTLSIESITVKMASEIRGNKELLETTKTQLQTEQERLKSLQSAYQAALAHEARASD